MKRAGKVGARLLQKVVETGQDCLQGLPDILAPGLSVIFCGINPGMRSAALGHHFAGRGNRFWRVLHLSGFTPHEMLPENDRLLLRFGYGLTSAAERPTVGASDLKRSDFIEGRPALERKIRRDAPRYVAFLGKAQCSGIFSQREVMWGRQSQSFGGAAVWVLPNPSGLNCAFTLENLTVLYSELFEATISSGADSASLHENRLNA
jgi:TDG/mug DNA glycosylase family protein